MPDISARNLDELRMRWLRDEIKALQAQQATRYTEQRVTEISKKWNTIQEILRKY